jgi:hypothetical protein
VAALAATLLGSSPAGAQTAPTSVVPAVAQPAGAPGVLMRVGASVFALTYLGSSLAATTAFYTDSASSSYRTDLWVPFVGPFAQMASTSSAGLDVLLALDGLAQLGGMAMFVYGVAQTRPVGVASNGPSNAPRLSLASLAVRGGSGAALVGTF